MHIRSQFFGDVHGWRPDRLVSSVEQAANQPYDYVILTTKALPDIMPTSQILAPLLSPQYIEMYPQPAYLILCVIRHLSGGPRIRRRVQGNLSARRWGIVSRYPNAFPITINGSEAVLLHAHGIKGATGLAGVGCRCMLLESSRDASNHFRIHLCCCRLVASVRPLDGKIR